MTWRSSSSRWRRKTRLAGCWRRRPLLSEQRAGRATRTLLDVVQLSGRYLADRGLPDARLDAELLSAHALGLRRIDLYLQFERELDETELETIRAMLRRRAAGEPVAYITGERDFYSRTFSVTPDVLVPRPETEILVEHALRELRARSASSQLRVGDLGTGSGCIAVTLAAELPELHVEAIDLSDAALRVAADNAARHGVADRVSFRCSSWADGLGEFDVVVSNPPYVTEAELAAADKDVRAFEPVSALLAGADGLDAYRAIADSLNGHLRSGAAVLLEVDSARADAARDIVSSALACTRSVVHRDLAGRQRVVELWVA